MDPIQTFLSAALSAATSIGTPTTTSATASFQFNPSISQEEACKRAEDRAKVAALYKLTGQEMHASNTTMCRDAGEYSCESVISTYESTRGVIETFKKTNERVSNWVCTVDITVKVLPTQRDNPTWLQAQATMDRGFYIPTDVASLTVTTNDRGFVTIFKFDPVTDEVTKIFPPNDPYTNIQRWTYDDKPLVVPVSLRDYDARRFPHFLLVTVSSSPLTNMKSYSLSSFYKMWDNHPIKDKVLIRTSFYVRSKP